MYATPVAMGAHLPFGPFRVARCYFREGAMEPAGSLGALLLQQFESANGRGASQRAEQRGP